MGYPGRYCVMPINSALSSNSRETGSSIPVSSPKEPLQVLVICRCVFTGRLNDRCRERTEPKGLQRRSWRWIADELEATRTGRGRMYIIFKVRIQSLGLGTNGRWKQKRLSKELRNGKNRRRKMFTANGRHSTKGLRGNTIQGKMGR